MSVGNSDLGTLSDNVGSVPTSALVPVTHEEANQGSMMNNDELSPERAELLTLRARIVVAERAALAGLELMLRIRPEQLTVVLEATRRGLAEGYLDETFAPDLRNPAERAFVAKEVERLMRALQDEMGFAGGVQAPESG